jgi:hypothetical protein
MATFNLCSLCIYGSHNDAVSSTEKDVTGGWKKTAQ